VVKALRCQALLLRRERLRAVVSGGTPVQLHPPLLFPLHQQRVLGQQGAQLGRSGAVFGVLVRHPVQEPPGVP